MLFGRNLQDLEKLQALRVRWLDFDIWTVLNFIRPFGGRAEIG